MSDDTTADQIAALEAQLPSLALPRFTHDDAWALGSWLVAAAKERSFPVVIDIRKGDQQVFHAALDGTSADNDSWVERKVRTVRRYALPSLLIGLRYKARGADFYETTGVDRADYVVAGGCIPIVVDGVGMVGTATVSGLAQEDDHALVAEAIEHLKATIA